ncbi:MAG: hypothetical protein HZC40_25330 [Chloroflexi bacterium]|nr:hypothetical protein [Chloroflexota bacterium]
MPTLTRTATTLSSTAIVTRTPTASATATLARTATITATRAIAATATLKPDATQARPHSQAILYTFSLRAFERANPRKETTQFNKPVTIRVRYDPSSLKGVNEQHLALAYWDPSKKQWQVIPSAVDTRTRTVSAQTNHFSDYGLTSAPDIQNYLPNVASAQTDLFNGSATASYALDVPPGRNGLAPRLALAYSSSGVDMVEESAQMSLVGAGWALTTNYIARNTRSTFDSSDDIFKLVLNGAGYELVRDATDTTVYHTWSKQYWRITYNATNDRWLVITEDGTQYQYGYSANSRAVQWRRDGDPNHTRQETYAWHLEKAIDPHANEIAFTYLHDTKISDCGQGGSFAFDDGVYPQFIRYNANLTEIAFTYSARNDYRFYATNTQCESPIQRWKLDRVDVKTTASGLQLVRRYDFVYDYSTFPGVFHWPTKKRLRDFIPVGRLALTLNRTSGLRRRSNGASDSSGNTQ